jgi:hypothetical protein
MMSPKSALKTKFA